jgi:hypothetical protein
LTAPHEAAVVQGHAPQDENPRPLRRQIADKLALVAEDSRSVGCCGETGERIGDGPFGGLG